MNLSERHQHEYLIYNRKSTDDTDNQRNSLAYQKQRNLEYAQRLELPVASTLSISGFCESGIIGESHSAYKQDDEFSITPDGAVQYRVLRPKFFKLTELLKEKKVKGAIFLCWDRASRNEQDGLVLKKLIKLGSDIRFVEATYDNTSAGDLHRDIDGVFASYYSRSISEKVRNTLRKLRAERRCVYISPLGYLDHGSDTKPFDPKRAPIIKRIFEHYATGKWSIRQLAKWARAQGLTKKPKRRWRTKEEIANNVDHGSIPKIAQPVDHKTIEYILKNPFYIGKVKVGNGEYVDSAAHEPLIDTSLFLQVQALLKKRRVSVYYVDRPFYTYRGFARCECGRLYSPYPQKASVYYRCSCKHGCANGDANLTESDITSAVYHLLNQCYLTDSELAELERRAPSMLPELEEQREKTAADLHAKRRTIQADLAYLTENRVSLIRTGVMTADLLHKEEERLTGKLRELAAEIQSCTNDVPTMFRYVLSVSDAIKHLASHFPHALDSQRRDIVAVGFDHLVFRDKQLVDYAAKGGFAALLKRPALRRQPPPSLEPKNGEDPYLFPPICNTGAVISPAEFWALEPENEETPSFSGAHRLSAPHISSFSNFLSIYKAAKQSMDELNRLTFLPERKPPERPLH